MRRIIVGLATAVLAFLPCDRAGALTPVIQDCAVRGSGAFASGHMFEGSGSTVGGIFSVAWEHTGPGVEFRADVAEDRRVPGRPAVTLSASRTSPPTLPAASARLRVRTPGDGGDDAPVIAVQATLAPAIPAVGSPDIYAVTVFDARGNIVYDFGENLDDGEGDIIVNWL